MTQMQRRLYGDRRFGMWLRWQTDRHSYYLCQFWKRVLGRVFGISPSGMVPGRMNPDVMWCEQECSEPFWTVYHYYLVYGCFYM